MKIKVFSVIILLIMILSLTPSSFLQALPVAAATPIYVDGTLGDDNYDGSSPIPGSGDIGPKQTIQGGQDAVTIGGTIYVAAGTYNEDIWIGDNLTFIGAGANTTIISHYPVEVNEPVVQISTEDQPKIVTVTISGFTIRNGSNHDVFSERCGGGVTVGTDCVAYLNNCAIVENEADKGGGICNWGTLYLNDCTIDDNNAERGGGIYNRGSLHVDRCCVSSNSAQFTGGGLNNYDKGQVWLTNCTISANDVWEYDWCSGGGIYNESTMAVLNCTIAYNSAAGVSVSVGGGFADISPTTMTFKNTIVAHNTAGNDTYNNGNSPEGGVTSLGNNIDSENSCGFDQFSDQIDTDPQLGPLQNNGGSTATHAITDSSPAFNTGNNEGAPAADQRGVSRPQGISCDIGAFELEQGEEPEPPPAITVGGEAYPVNKVGLVAPWVILAISVAVGCFYLARRRTHNLISKWL
ncbi:choice-of-anchor Q domain-containing protein [Chloroflexota bacterium]